jgi:hypothetical protein
LIWFDVKQEVVQNLISLHVVKLMSLQDARCQCKRRSRFECHSVAFKTGLDGRLPIISSYQVPGSNAVTVPMSSMQQLNCRVSS